MLTICHAIQHFACVNAFNQQLEIVRVLQPFLGEKCMKNSRWYVFVKNRKKILFYATSEKYIWGRWRTHYFFQQSKAVVLLSLNILPESPLLFFFVVKYLPILYIFTSLLVRNQQVKSNNRTLGHVPWRPCLLNFYNNLILTVHKQNFWGK